MKQYSFLKFYTQFGLVNPMTLNQQLRQRKKWIHKLSVFDSPESQWGFLVKKYQQHNASAPNSRNNKLYP